jgi:hypothetical protein
MVFLFDCLHSNSQPERNNNREFTELYLSSLTFPENWNFCITLSIRDWVQAWRDSKVQQWIPYHGWLNFTFYCNSMKSLIFAIISATMSSHNETCSLLTVNLLYSTNEAYTYMYQTEHLQWYDR